MLAVLRVLRRPSWIGLTLLVVVLCITFVELGQWQLRRHDQRVAANAVLTGNLDRPAVEITAVMPGDQPLPTDAQWRLVKITGTYDVEHQVLVRNQSFDGELGYDVVTPLVPNAGAAVLVMRGWVPAGNDAQTVPEVPLPPAGEVEVPARLRQSDGTDPGSEGLPPQQVRHIAVPAIAATLPYPTVSGAYVSVVPGAPGSDAGEAGPRPIPPPEPGLGPHLAYAVQWYLFGVIGIVGWVMLLRSNVREEAALGVRADAPFAEPRPVGWPQ